jgi:hypothetical protein
VRFSRAVVVCGLLGLAFARAQNIPAPKMDLIRQAMAAMKIDQRILGLVSQRVAQKTQAIRVENPGVGDSLIQEARGVIATVYAENLDGSGGLMPRIYAILDKRLTEEDLKFAVKFRGSDQGKRYRELVPRVVNESVEAGRDWSDKLEPEIRRRLEDGFRGQGMKF